MSLSIGNNMNRLGDTLRWCMQGLALHYICRVKSDQLPRNVSDHVWDGLWCEHCNDTHQILEQAYYDPVR